MSNIINHIVEELNNRIGYCVYTNVLISAHQVDPFSLGRPGESRWTMHGEFTDGGANDLLHHEPFAKFAIGMASDMYSGSQFKQFNFTRNQDGRFIYVP